MAGVGGTAVSGRREGAAADAALVNGLSAAGLDPKTWDIYRSMLRDPGLGPEELAAQLSCEVDQVLAALDRLARLALLGTSTSSPHQLRPVSPEVALRRLVSEAEGQLRRRQSEITALRDEVDVLVEEHRQAREARFSRQIELLSTPDAVVGAIEELTAQTRQEVLSFITGQINPHVAEEARQRDQQLLDRGLTMRAIYLEGQANRAFLANSRWYRDLGTEIRLSPTLPMQMLVYDRSAAVTAIDPQNPSAGAMVVRASGLVTAMVALFELQWAASRAPEGEEGSAKARRSASSEQGPSQLEQAVLVLLARGQKDEALARSLGISVRSVRRIVSTLSDRLGARSRFELAIQATRCGWL